MRPIIINGILDKKLYPVKSSEHRSPSYIIMLRAVVN